MSDRRDWVTVKKAEERTGLAATFFDERTGAAGVWPEGQVWKWYEGRKLLNLEAVYDLIEAAPSVASRRGRRRDQGDDECHAAQATRQA